MAESRALIVCCLFAGGVLFATPFTGLAEDIAGAIPADWAPEGVTAALVIRNTVTGETWRSNAEQCAKRLSPCSTFKILNCAIAVDEGIATDENSILKWDGRLRPVKAWNRDLSVKQAMACSAVPHFQRLAATIGKERMAHYLQAAGYGNMDMSSGLTTFWLGASLLVSADDQVAFLEKFFTGRCPIFSEKTVRTVKAAIRISVTDKGVLYGKTGTMAGSREGLGWFVGLVEPRDGDALVFALNLEGRAEATGKRAKQLLMRILTAKGVL